MPKRNKNIEKVEEIINDSAAPEDEEGADDLSLLPGVGPATAEKLRENGFTDLMAIAVTSPSNLSEMCSIGEGTAAKIISSARKLADVGNFLTGVEVMERRKSVEKLTTSSTAFDELLGGGVETQAITEVYGEFGSGKTQIAHQLAVNCTLKKGKGGFNSHVVIIDTENTFRPERIAQMAEGQGVKPTVVMKSIHVGRAYNSHHQMLLVDKAGELAREFPVKLLIVDSLTAHFRAEYMGRGALAGRQQKLNKHIHELQKFADKFNCAVLVTNQVMSRPDVFFGDPTKPIGGHILGHASTFRIYLRKSKGDRRIARLVDSPCLPEAEAVLTIVTDGVRD
ncbi:MAG: DNA repair and recombination protein RadA [Candidatus Thermoplasmatota archaeon]|jgi:DNA repair protein RadA|nr:DNA repair and recombination protein RadA [Candidatus Thermoplasmatota archaeon]MDP7263980.1 DNA repair and recombination protein RadA [Candidatus Thermoplasmatota archaeon]